jgi:AAA15 family ATPase/GTPase
MEESHLISFEVKGFKKFTDLKVDNTGQFNLIVGDNNSGKTTLLEALLADKNSNKFLEYLSDIFFHIKKFDNLNDNFLSYYFSNTLDEYPYQIKFKLLKAKNNFDFIQFSKINRQQILFAGAENHEIQNDRGSQINIREDRNKPFNFDSPFIPFGSLYSHELTKQYSNNIQLFVDKKEKLLDSLSHIIKDIKNIEVNASYSHNPILLISEKNKNKLSPLATYGDGTVKLFRILLSLFSNDYYDRLMIDEIDAGVHYSRLKDFLKSLILVAKEQGKQLFATTHSKECIEYFKDALQETKYENDGRIIRLANTKSGIKAYTMPFEEFENALIAESEIR